MYLKFYIINILTNASTISIIIIGTAFRVPVEIYFLIHDYSSSDNICSINVKYNITNISRFNDIS